MIKWIVSKFTMKRKRFLFIDQVEGKEVFLYVDKYGTEWMANYNHWTYRVKRGI